MDTFQYYSDNNPTEGELVLVQFTEKTDAFFDAKLLEYPYRGMMSFQDATKRRKVSSWNKIVPLNKDMVARVEEVDEDAHIVQLSIAYLDDGVPKDEATPEKIQEKLLMYFNDNKLMVNFIKSLCIIHKYEFNYVWTQLVHHIDVHRREYNDENDENISMWKYFCDNFESLDDWVGETELDGSIAGQIRELYEKRTEVAPHKISSKIGIISLGGVNPTKDLLTKVLGKLDYKYSFRYDTTPYYHFESFSDDSSDQDHQKLIKELETESQKYTPKIFIKVDFCAKHSS
jgi:translation initiation factor 2 alpha subunit (eIF-2alpha)